VGRGFSIAWRTLDAQYWGIPQRRRRIFLIADFGGGRAGEILFKPESLPGNIETGRSGGERAASYSERRFRETTKKELDQYTVDFGRMADRIQMNPKTSVTLSNGGGGCGAKTGLYCLPVKTFPFQRIGEYKESNIGKTLAERDYKSPTDLIVQDYIVRRLTPTECERLQGFPDGWTAYGENGKTISDSQRYKALGNSLAIPCVEKVLKEIKSLFTERMELSKYRGKT
jgi:DNA (cytosine-5)-methyltransferase 1